MKTTTRTTLPDSTHEQPVHELKLSKWARYLLYFMIVSLLFFGCFFWWFCYFNLSPELVKAGEPGAIAVIFLVMFSLGGIVYVASMATVGDIYFYERYVEIRRFLPFMKRLVIYYDKMHVHIGHMGRVNLNHYETQPKFWKSPYTWLKASILDVIYFPLNYDFEILEFVKTKAQSVSYYNFMGQKLN